MTAFDVDQATAEFDAQTTPAPPSVAGPTRLKSGFYLRGQLDYGATEAINFSTAKNIEISPLHYQHGLKFARKETRPMSLGLSNHVAVLEPERFATNYVQWETTWNERNLKPKKELGSKRVRSGSEWKAFQLANAGKTIINDTDFESALRFRDAVRRNADVMPLLALGDPEVAMVWQDRETGLWLRGRVDWKGKILGGGADFNGRECITDLKGARDITDDAFGRQCAKLSYHVQQAMYADGYETITGERPLVAVAAVEMAEPHDAVPYFFSEAELEAGRSVYQGWLKRIAECRNSNQWPGLGAGGLRVLRLPSYSYDDNDEDLDLTSDGERLGV